MLIIDKKLLNYLLNLTIVNIINNKINKFNKIIIINKSTLRLNKTNRKIFLIFRYIE